MRLMTRPLQPGILLAAIIVSAAASAATEAPIAAQAASLSVRIAGNHFVDGAGRTVRLLGVNRSGTEYECMANNGFFDGPGDAASVAAMASWNIDAVRVPLNEDCWLGINGAPAAYSGTNYRNAIAGYVSRLHAAGMYAIVDLHWNAQGSLPADGRTGQGRQMADLDHSPAFWSSVASFFKNDHGVVFDLFNEPHDISWDCWLNGCTTSDGTGTWQAAGMQTLLNAVRATGATNVVTLSANGWGGDIPQWLNYRPRDPAGQIAAGWHVYFPETFYSDPARRASAGQPPFGGGQRPSGGDDPGDDRTGAVQDHGVLPGQGQCDGTQPWPRPLDLGGIDRAAGRTARIHGNALVYPTPASPARRNTGGRRRPAAVPRF